MRDNASPMHDSMRVSLETMHKSTDKAENESRKLLDKAPTEEGDAQKTV